MAKGRSGIASGAWSKGDYSEVLKSNDSKWYSEEYKSDAYWWGVAAVTLRLDSS